MPSGETLLKITHYPFIYSALTLVFKFFGWDPASNNYIPFFAFAGIIGTFLSITDPFGKIVQFVALVRAMKFYKDIEHETEKGYSTPEYIPAAFKDAMIRYEINKLVSYLYFAGLLGFFIFLIAMDKFELVNSTNNFFPNCDNGCIKFNIILYLSGAILFLGIVIAYTGKDLISRLLLSSYYHFCVYSDFCIRSTVENFGKAISQQNWGEAQRWAAKAQWEWDHEASFEEKRTAKVREHITQIINQFGKYMGSYYRTSISNLQIKSSTEGMHLFADIHETIIKFPLGRSLVSHFYTDPENQKSHRLLVKSATLKLKLLKIQESIKIKIENNLRIIEKLFHAEGFELDNARLINRSTQEHLHLDYLEQSFSEWWKEQYRNHPLIHKNPDPVTNLTTVDFCSYNGIGMLNEKNLQIFLSQAEVVKNELNPELTEIFRLNNEMEQINEELKSQMDYLISATIASGEPLLGICEICDTSDFRSTKDMEDYRRIFPPINWNELGFK